jgi:hypothetical protein
MLRGSVRSLLCAPVYPSQVARDAVDLGLSMRWGEAARPDSTGMGTILRLRHPMIPGARSC